MITDGILGRLSLYHWTKHYIFTLSCILGWTHVFSTQIHLWNFPIPRVTALDKGHWRRWLKWNKVVMVEPWSDRFCVLLSRRRCQGALCLHPVSTWREPWEEALGTGLPAGMFVLACLDSRTVRNFCSSIRSSMGLYYGGWANAFTDHSLIWIMFRWSFQPWFLKHKTSVHTR